MRTDALAPAPDAAGLLTEPRLFDRARLAQALQETRRQTLRLNKAYASALGPELAVPLSPELNPPLWELGHVGWFADWWIARNPQRGRGAQADPLTPRFAARQARHQRGADALYNSSEVPHDARWSLALPGLTETRHHLAESLTQTLQLLEQATDDDQGLYFFRLALFHEAMHAEAAVVVAQNLGIAINVRSTAAPKPARRSTLALPATAWTLGHNGPGFCFDNECGAHTVDLAAFELDAQAVSWARFLPFIDAGGYEKPEYWTPAGWAWRQATDRQAPRYLQRDAQSGSGWLQRRFEQHLPLDLRKPAVHLSQHEALAWCRWAGRRLPTEAEWEYAAHTQAGFDWGRVWEWTASAFAPYPGFVAHPYQDYSRPWFDGRPVLRGASTATPACLRHRKYRNFFPAERNDIPAGFRSAAL